MILKSDFKKYCGFYQEIRRFGKLDNNIKFLKIINKL